MYRKMIALGVLLAPLFAFSASAGGLDTPSPGSLYAPTYNTLGETASTRLTTITPRGDISPSGPIGTDSRELKRGAIGPGRDPLLERHLDCFSTAVEPGRDSRNAFLSRCPGNAR
jgi:hypothetical protein